MARNVKIDDRVWRELKQKLEKAEGAHVKVGVLASKGGAAKHPNSDLTLVQLAAIHEYGSPAAGIPERSYIRRTFHQKNKLVARRCATLAKAFIEGKISLARALDVLGSFGATEVRKTVTTGPGVPPPLAASTIERKGSSRPLVDTGRLLGSIQWEVVDAGDTGRAGYKK